MRIDILTLFPEIALAPLSESIIQRARAAGLVEIHAHNLRDWATASVHAWRAAGHGNALATPNTRHRDRFSVTGPTKHPSVTATTDGRDEFRLGHPIHVDDDGSRNHKTESLADLPADSTESK